MERKEAELRMLRKRLHDTRCRLREAKARAKDLEKQVEYLERAREIHPALALSLARGGIENTLRADTERAQALLKLTECEMWLGRCTPRETAAPAHGGGGGRRRAAGRRGRAPRPGRGPRRVGPHEGRAQAHAEIGGGLMARADAAGCALAAENLLELLRGLPDSLARTLAVRAAEECALWIDEIEEDE